MMQLWRRPVDDQQTQKQNVGLQTKQLMYHLGEDDEVPKMSAHTNRSVNSEAGSITQTWIMEYNQLFNCKSYVFLYKYQQPFLHGSSISLSTDITKYVWKVGHLEEQECGSDWDWEWEREWEWKDSGNDFGLSLEKLTLGPRKKLLVMNLSGLLLHRAFKRDTPRIPKHRRPDVVFGKHLGKTINTFMF